jgi:hypothetical protein
MWQSLFSRSKKKLWQSLHVMISAFVIHFMIWYSQLFCYIGYQLHKLFDPSSTPCV